MAPRTPLYKLPDGGTPAVTPRIAMRIAVLGVTALALFAIVFFRLWFLQVLSGEQYLAKANNNRVREIKTEAPRGEIVDRRGSLLVGNRPAWAVQIDPQRLPEGPARDLVLRRVAKLLDIPEGRVKRRVREGLTELPFSNATVSADVAYSQVVRLLEHQGDYPGINVAQTFQRSYPRGDLAAHLFGYVREINGEQLKTGKYENAALGDRIGQDGLERQYDRFLRGSSGLQRIQVDAGGYANGPRLATTPPQPGEQLRLSLDLGVQQVGEQALRTASGLARSNGNGGTAGAFVAMDVRNGEILAMASTPSFDPSVFTRPFDQKTSDGLFKVQPAPYTNRAIASGYPAGSTFKLISSIAALDSKIYTPDTVIADGGKIKIADRFFQNAGGFANGPVALRRALQVSSDVYFYNFGRLANLRGGDIIQHWATRLGLGQKTGIDLPGEAAGLVPTPRWRNKQKPYRWNGQTVQPRKWSVGDTVNLATGQGDLAVTPLQMAVAYAAMGNGGYVVRPHLGVQVAKSQGESLQEIKQPPRRRVNIDPGYRRAIMEGLRAAANDPGGTSADVFGDFPVYTVAGKTGTAQTPKGDQSWYVALAPYPNPKYAVAVTVEQGGFGAESAAPAARLILAKLLNVRLKEKVVAGTSKTR